MTTFINFVSGLLNELTIGNFILLVIIGSILLFFAEYILKFLWHLLCFIGETISDITLHKLL